MTHFPLPFRYGTIRVTVDAEPADQEWIALLFTWHPTPFKVLHDLGYTPTEDS